MKPAQKLKIKKAIKKAWKEGKYEHVFKSRGKPEAEKQPRTKPIVFEMQKEKTMSVLVFLENAEKILLTFQEKYTQNVVERIKVAMSTYETLDLIGFGFMFKLNREGSIVDVLNGRKIIGYSAL